ncbi:hypothetical protein ES288_A13G059400v1 [Gossypium darwinii]|uniref:Uncharacterized protein n=1 Tax=Gossypium darwinii TaxID=34276 RepID=A0A5D2DWP3_GOSDA|nr:hypothetical protein ES288_A13G059400v1 [Gossypium darwinii]
MGTKPKQRLWWSTESSIRIDRFHGFRRSILNPQQVLLGSQTLSCNCMCCFITFLRNELELTRRKVPRQILHIPGRIEVREELQQLQQLPLSEPGYDP